jgi:hypothetical protein
MITLNDEVSGQTYEFPDDATEAEISSFMARVAPVPIKEEGGVLRQAGIGIAQGFAELGKGGNAALEFLNRPVMTLGPVAFTPTGPRYAPIAEAATEQFRGASLVAGEMSQDLEKLGQATEGPAMARQIGSGATSVLPALAAAPLGIPAAILAGGVQQFGGTYAEAQNAYGQQGLGNEEAARKAVLPAVIDGAKTAAITFLSGKLLGPGVEGAGRKVVVEGLRRKIADFTKGVVGEGVLEEGPDQFLSEYLVARLSYDPTVTFDKAWEDAKAAAIIGGVLGGGVHLMTAQGGKPSPLDPRPSTTVQDPDTGGDLVIPDPNAASDQQSPISNPQSAIVPAPISPMPRAETAVSEPGRGTPPASPMAEAPVIPAPAEAGPLLTGGETVQQSAIPNPQSAIQEEVSPNAQEVQRQTQVTSPALDPRPSTLDPVLALAQEEGLEPSDTVQFVSRPDWRNDGGQLIEGSFDPATGITTINTATAPERVRAMIREEVAHQKLSADEQAQRDLQQFAQTHITPEVQAQMASEGYAQNEGEAEADYRARLADEYVAKQARENTAWWVKFVDKVAALLDKAGIRNLSRDQVARVILRGVEARVQGRKQAVGVEGGRPASQRGQPAGAPKVARMSVAPVSRKEILGKHIKTANGSRYYNVLRDGVRYHVRIADHFNETESRDIATQNSLEDDRIARQTGIEYPVNVMIKVAKPITREEDAFELIAQAIEPLRGKSVDALYEMPAADDIAPGVSYWGKAKIVADASAIRNPQSAIPRQSVAPPDAPTEGERQHAQKIMAASDIPDEIKRRVENLVYTKRSNESDAAFAVRVIDAIGSPQDAMAVFGDMSNGLHEAVRTHLGGLIVKQMAQAERIARLANETQVADQLALRAARFIDEQVLPRSTTIAQSLQAFAAFADLTPQGMVALGKRMFGRASENARTRLTAHLLGIIQQLNQASVNAVKQLGTDKAAQQATTTAVNEAVQADPKVQTAIRRDASARFGKLADMLADHFAGNDPSQTLAEKIVKLLKVSPVNANAVAKRVEAKWLAAVRARQATIITRLAAARAGKLTTTNGIDAAILAKLREMKTKLGWAILQHYTTQSTLGGTLEETLVREAGLSGTSARRLAAVIGGRVGVLSADAKRRLIERTRQSAVPRQLVRKSVVDRLVELSNAGVLMDQPAWDAVRERLNLAEFTPQLAAEIFSRANKLQELPLHSVQRRRATIDLLNHIQRKRGFPWYDWPMAFWYANILSGPTTHAVNMGANLLNLLPNAVLQATPRPGDWQRLAALPDLVAALVRGFRAGGIAAADVLATGGPSRTNKFEASDILEVQRFGQAGGTSVQSPMVKAVLESPAMAWLNAWRYVGRLLAAGDMLFYMPAREMKAAVASRMIAKETGLSGSALRAATAETLHATDAHRSAAEAQANAEGLTGLERLRRVDEILEQSRPDLVRERADDFALAATFNNKPYGVLGAISELINMLHGRIGVSRFIVPFTRIVANVTNESLMYFPPVGATRAAWAHWKLAQTGEGQLYGHAVKDMDTIADAYAKAGLGTMLLGILGAMAEASWDDEEGFAIHGEGPTTTEQKRQWRESGAIPNSIRVGGRYYSFQNSPAAIPLAILGNYSDAHRFRGLDKADAAARAAYAFQQFGHVILKNSFLDSIARLVGSLQTPSVTQSDRRLLETVLRTGSSFVVPNALRQVDRIFDPAVYDASTIQALLVSQVPFARRENKPALNAFGEPVTMPVSSRFTTKQGEDPVWVELARKNAWISVPALDDNDPDAHYDLIEARGPALRRSIEKAMTGKTIIGDDILPPITRATPEQAQRIVDVLTSRATEAAKERLGGYKR